MRILVVDDDPLAGEMSAAMLEEHGYEVVLVENGAEALEYITSGVAIDLAVSDLNMPLISGIDLFHELRSRQNSIPFILLTGDDAIKAREQAPGLTGCLMKDEFLEERLPALVAEILTGDTL